MTHDGLLLLVTSLFDGYRVLLNLVINTVFFSLPVMKVYITEEKFEADTTKTMSW